MSSVTRWRVRPKELYASLESIARYRRMSMQNVATDCGLSASSLTRLKQGHNLDMDAFATVLIWLGHAVPFTEAMGDPQKRRRR